MKLPKNDALRKTVKCKCRDDSCKSNTEEETGTKKYKYTSSCIQCTIWFGLCSFQDNDKNAYRVFGINEDELNVHKNLHLADSDSWFRSNLALCIRQVLDGSKQKLESHESYFGHNYNSDPVSLMDFEEVKRVLRTGVSQDHLFYFGALFAFRFSESNRELFLDDPLGHVILSVSDENNGYPQNNGKHRCLWNTEKRPLIRKAED